MIKKIIKFGAPWCGACVSADMALEQLKAVHPELEIQKIDIEEDEESANAYKVRALPTIVFIGADDKEQGRHTGKITISELIDVIEDHGI